MEPKRRQQVLLGVLVVVLLGAAAYQFWPSPAPAARAASNGRGATASGRAGRAAADTVAAVPSVRIDALAAKRPEPESKERNLFRFKPKAPPPPPPSSASRPGPGGTGGQPAQPPVPSGPPPPPPITLKFIGIVESGPGQAKIAVLSDGRAVLQGKEGDIIDGRYRILRIGTESIEMAYADGRGRQTIRLTGQ